MIFACISDEAGKTRIIEAIRICQKPHVYRRLMTIQLSAEGKKVSELTDIFKVTPQTIRAFIHAYNQGGVEQLLPEKKPGRRARLSLTQEQWIQIVHQPPCSFEKLNTENRNWTLELLSNYCQQYHSVKLCPSRLWYILRQHKINMGRSQLRITSPDPQYTQKRDRTEAIKKKPKLSN
ncbi:helix-turn-helix domain containing protein [Candidatus Poribacteria bacterium]|nr:helix-turn-helix domain containing protein [Candidatus Poribacteria bacterium]